MVEQNVIYGGLVAVAGLVAGAGLVALTEKAGVRSEERGALSYEVSAVGVVVVDPESHRSAARSTFGVQVQRKQLVLLLLVRVSPFSGTYEVLWYV